MFFIYTRIIGPAAAVALMLLAACTGAAPAAATATLPPAPAATAAVEPTATVVVLTESSSGTATDSSESLVRNLEDFFLDFDSPSETEIITDVTEIVVSGQTRADAVVSVNDTIVEIGLDGGFEIVVGLLEDINIIEVVASIATGEELGDIFTVIYAP